MRGPGRCGPRLNMAFGARHLSTFDITPRPWRCGEFFDAMSPILPEDSTYPTLSSYRKKRNDRCSCHSTWTASEHDQSVCTSFTSIARTTCVRLLCHRRYTGWLLDVVLIGVSWAGAEGHLGNVIKREVEYQTTGSLSSQ